MFPSQLLFLLLPLHLILLLGSKLFLADYFLTPAFAMRFLKRNSLSKMPSSLPNPSSPRFGCLSRNIANWDALSRCLWQGCSTNGRGPKVHGAIKRRTTHGRENGGSQTVCVTVFKLKRDLLVWLNGSVTRSLIMETDCLLPAKTIIIYQRPRNFRDKLPGRRGPKETAMVVDSPFLHETDPWISADSAAMLNPIIQSRAPRNKASLATLDGHCGVCWTRILRNPGLCSEIGSDGPVRDSSRRGFSYFLYGNVLLGSKNSGLGAGYIDVVSITFGLCFLCWRHYMATI